MAGSDDLVIQRFALEEVSDAVKGVNGNEFVSQLFVANIENTSGEPLDLETEVQEITNMMTQMLTMGKAKYSAGGDKFLTILNDGKLICTLKVALVTDEIQKKKMGKATVVTGKLASVTDEIQKKKGKAPVVSGKAAITIYEVLKDGMDKAPVEAMAAIDKMMNELTIDKNLTQRCKALFEAVESEDVLVEAGNEAMTINNNLTERSRALVEALETEEAVAIAMPIETPVYTEEDMDSARDQEIYDDFVRAEILANGYVEVEDEYLDQLAELEEYGRGLWDDVVKKHGGFAAFKFAGPSDPNYPGFSEWNNPDEVRAL